MITGILSFLFGILLLHQVSSLPNIYWSWGLLLLAFVPFISPRYAQARIVIFLIAGFLWALFRAHLVLDSGLETELQGKDVLVTGVISSIPQSDIRKTRFEFDIETLEYQNEKHSPLGKVRLNWYHTRSSGKSKNLKAGQRWQLWLRLKQPHGFLNPGGFDFEGWLYQKKIRATGYVRIKAKKQQYAKLLDKQAVGYPVLILRQFLYDKIIDVAGSYSNSGILAALAIGERQGMSQQQWRIFRQTGTSHLVAISGLHIGLLAGFVFFLVQRLWPYLGNAALQLASPRAAALASLILAMFYAALSGFAIPAQRALIMLSIVMISIFSLQKVLPSRVLALALFAVLILDPVAVLSPGFWLSFAAVAIIGLAAAGRLTLNQSWKAWGRLQWRISLALVPLLIFLFQQASLVSPITNLVAIPVVSFLVVPLVLLATSVVTFLPGLAANVYALSDTILSLLWGLLSIMADTPLSYVYAAKPTFLSLLLACLGFALLLAPRGWPIKFFGFFLIVPLVLPWNLEPEHGEVEFTLLDVGQGLAAVVKTHSHVLVFDTGAKFSDSFDTGAAVVTPFLRQKNISEIDTLIISHQDNDHRGGVASVREAFKVKYMLSSFAYPGSKPCYAGHRWHWDGVDFELLNPPENNQYYKRNNASCVLRVSAGNDAVLLAADIEKKAENELVERVGDKLRSTFLVSPHHGSKTSSSTTFLDTVKPAYVLIPVGYKNRYRMPHQEVIKRMEERNITVLRTYQSGAISFRFGQKSSNKIPQRFRDKQQKYWNSRH